MECSVRGILLDIEGTTSSIRFVYDVMFPFARRELANYLDSAWGDDDLAAACELIAVDAGHDSLAAWETASGRAGRQLVEDEIVRLMDDDVKATGLKQLQGLIWRAGFESGEMRAHLYDDVAPAISSWRGAGCSVRIYSSGSTGAQKLFFGHTVAGDLLDHFDGHYDTTSGPKREADSYRRIAADFACDAQSIVFFSDVVEELDAARRAGLQTVLVCRPGNAAVDDRNGHPAIESFAEVTIET